MSTTRNITIVSHKGQSFRRLQKGREILWQSAEASPEWGYWYSTRRQAAKESNASDRMMSGI